jgi:predicted alpha/beta superfamily hydrolase
MKILNLLFLTLSLNFSAQENKKIEFDSKILSEIRTINIHIPKSYTTSEKSYPVIYSLDGDYTNFALNGTLDYYSFWDKTPECIVVSIDQNYLDTVENKYKRWLDCSYSWTTGFPKDRGVDFKEFISKELIPFIDSSYRTTNFRTIIGHSFTANYVNYFLLDKIPVFTGYVAISPYYASNGLDSLKTIVENLKTPIFYYVASGEMDLSGHKKSVSEFDKVFSKIDNVNFNYKIFDMKNNQATHYTIFPIALPNAIEHLFSAYGSINESEFRNLLKEDNKIAYLKERYEKIEDIYGIALPLREEDLNVVAYAISKKKQWDQLKQIAELTIEIYPESFLGYWTLGEYYEKTGNFTSALEKYELGFGKLGDDILNISDFQKNIDRVKSKIK